MKRRLLPHIFFSLSLTNMLIFVNLIVFILVMLLDFIINHFYGFSLFGFLALQPNNLLDLGHIWTLLTSTFLHANFFHLFVNMFSLYFLGNFLEMIIGRKRFLWLYLLSGILAGLFYVVLSYFFGVSVLGAKIFGAPDVYAVGASGVIFAIAGVLALLTPRNRVYLIAGPLIAIVLGAALSGVVGQNYPGLMNLLDIVINVYILVCIFSLISFNDSLRRIALPIEMPFWILPIVAIIPLVIVGLFVELPIGNSAHLGGFIAGALYGVYLKIRYKKKTRLIARTFS